MHRQFIIFTMTISEKQLLLEAATNQGYANDYTDGRANGRAKGRQEGMKIVQRRIAQALQREGVAPVTIAKVLNLSSAAIEVCLPDVILSGEKNNKEPVKSR